MEMDYIYNGPHYDSRKHWTDDIAFWQRQTNRQKGKILELGCGTGRITIPIAQEGKKISGLEFNDSMIESAKIKASKHKVKIDFYLADMRYFSLNDRFDLIILPYNTIFHLVSLQDFQCCISCVKNHLTPKGKFIVDAWIPNMEKLARKMDDFQELEKYYDPITSELIVLMTRSNYDQVDQIDLCEFIFKHNDIVKSKVEQPFRIYFPKELEALLILNGFEIESIFGDYDENIINKNSRRQIFTVCKP